MLGLGGALLLLPKKAYDTVSFLLCRKDESAIVWEFPLEYNYSVVTCMFAVTLTYSIAHPPILPLGLLYGLCKLLADKHSLLFAHEGDLDAYFAASGSMDQQDLRGATTQSYHQQSMDRTIHNCLTATIAIFQLAMFGELACASSGVT